MPKILAAALAGLVLAAATALPAQAATITCKPVKGVLVCTSKPTIPIPTVPPKTI
jgi:hypothetical protein